MLAFVVFQPLEITQATPCGRGPCGCPSGCSGSGSVVGGSNPPYLNGICRYRQSDGTNRSVLFHYQQRTLPLANPAGRSMPASIFPISPPGRSWGSGASSKCCAFMFILYLRQCWISVLNLKASRAGAIGRWWRSRGTLRQPVRGRFPLVQKHEFQIKAEALCVPASHVAWMTC